jgi:hypothetical protein
MNKPREISQGMVTIAGNNVFEMNGLIDEIVAPVALF